MGWSCSAKGSDVLQAWSDKCFANSGLTNVWNDGQDSYMYEISNREHDDGSITGKIIKRVGESGWQGKVVGSLKIDGDGNIVRAPKFLKSGLNIRDTSGRGIGSGG
jgi:hypothetical protein